MTETQLISKIAAALRSQGAWVTKIHGGNMQQAGLPDLIVVHTTGTWFVEVKLPGGMPTRLQRHILERIKTAGGNVAVVRSVEDAEVLIGERNRR